MELGLIMTANFSLYEMRFDKGIDAKELQNEIIKDEPSLTGTLTVDYGNKSA